MSHITSALQEMPLVRHSDQVWHHDIEPVLFGEVRDRLTRVYWNLHRSCWSIQQKVEKRGWRVVGHASFVTLSGVEPVVYKAGQARVRATGVKNVHAYLEGYLTPVGADHIEPKTKIVMRIVYDPRKNDTFEYIPLMGMNVASRPLRRARMAFLTSQWRGIPSKEVPLVVAHDDDLAVDFVNSRVEYFEE